MNLEKTLFALEEQFWKGDAAFYAQKLTKDSLMVFADPVGVLPKDAAVEAIAGGIRWEDVTFTAAQVVRLTDDAAVLAYRANARKEGESTPYNAWISSVYIRRNGEWLLAHHQQTPDGA